MRYDTKIIFVSSQGKHYDPDLGQYVSKKTIEEKDCSISSMSFERQNLVFGNLVTGRSVVETKRPYTKKFDYLEVKGQKYKKINHQHFRNTSTFIVEESNE